MMRTRTAKSIAGLVLVVAGLWSGSQAAQAIVFKGGYDPVNGLVGDVFVDVPLNCILSVTAFEPTGVTPPDCGNVTFLSATVTGPTPPAPITFGAFGNSVVTGLNWVNGSLAAIDTMLIGPSTSPTGYFLQFTSNDSPSDLTTSVSLFRPSICERDDSQSCTGLVTTALNGQIGFAPVTVPEPGSLALLASAMCGGWLVRRRTVTLGRVRSNRG